MNKLEEMITEAKNIVVFSGAGFSTESNIPDFRSSGGIYKDKSYLYDCEKMLSHDFFMNHSKLFYEFYRSELIYEEALPNKGHFAVAKLEAIDKLEAIITQNIDGLHQMAGNKKVLELHGSIHRNYCMNCHEFYGLGKILTNDDIPVCEICGGLIKPDVVLYQEPLNSNIVEDALRAMKNADLLIIAGTSLTVYPAAGFIEYYQGKDIVLINHDATAMDDRATFVSRDNIGDVLNFINEKKL